MVKKLESGLINNKDEVYVRIEFELKKNDPDLCIGYTLFYNDIILFRSEQIDDDESKWPKLKIGRNIIYSRIPTNLLNSGNYLLKLTSSLFNIRWIFDYKKDDTPFLTFRISDNLSNSKFIIYGKRNTIISPIMRWYSL